MNSYTQLDDGPNEADNKNLTANAKKLTLGIVGLVLFGSLFALAVSSSGGNLFERNGGNAGHVHFRLRAPDANGLIHLKQIDFDRGTVRLTQPGNYILDEDILFEPNPTGGLMNDPGAFLPDFATQAAEYDLRSYRRGFFSAITIETRGVHLDLNGFWIKQTRAFFLQQVVYAHITLASAPFIAGIGPADFGTLIPAKDCVVRNGFLGLSSHHGIHGNDAMGCVIEDLEIVDWEVAGIALNNVVSTTISRCIVGPPVAPLIRTTYGNGRFMLQFLRAIPLRDRLDKQITFSGGRSYSAQEVLNRLEVGMNLVFREFVYGDAVRNLPGFSDEFDNLVQVQDGSSQYGIVINGVGPAVTGIGFSPAGSARVLIQDTTVNGMVTETRGVPAVVRLMGAEPEISIGPTGESVDVLRLSDLPVKPLADYRRRDIATAKYVGNLLSDALFTLNEFGACDLRAGTPFHISPDIRNWAILGTPLPARVLTYVCNGDCQFHVVKGVFGIRIEGTQNFVLKNVDVFNVESRGEHGSLLCGRYTQSHPESGETLGYGGTAAYGISITQSTGRVSNSFVSHVKSLNGVAYGMVVWSNSTVTFDDLNPTSIFDIYALGASPPNPPQISGKPVLPNRVPSACGLDIQSSTVTINGQKQSLDSSCLVSAVNSVCPNRTFGFVDPTCPVIAKK